MRRPRAPELALSIMSILLPGLAVRVRITALTLALLAAAACRESRPPEAFPTVVVEASGETEPVATADADAADDPAIWRNPADPEASWIVGTDKKAGVHVYGLDGRSRFFLADGRLNNVDLVDGGGMGVIVVASDRNDPGAAVLRIYRLETRAPALIPLGTVAGGVGEAYGLALWLGPEGLHAYSVLKSGAIEEVLIDLSGGSPVGRTLRRMQLASQAEGCVVDPRDGTLYVAEEAFGIWRFGRIPRGTREPSPQSRPSAYALKRSSGRGVI
jgi:3-phytase